MTFSGQAVYSLKLCVHSYDRCLKEILRLLSLGFFRDKHTHTNKSQLILHEQYINSACLEGSPLKLTPRENLLIYLYLYNAISCYCFISISKRCVALSIVHKKEVRQCQHCTPQYTAVQGTNKQCTVLLITVLRFLLVFIFIFKKNDEIII